MKFISWFIAAIVVLPMMFLADLKIEAMKATQNQKMLYDVILEDAVQDAAIELSEPAMLDSYEQGRRGKEIDIKKTAPNLDKALERFYKTMYINMNIENDKAAQEGFKIYCPLKLVVAYNGYFINTWEKSDTQKNTVREVWKPEKFYTFEDKNNNLIINFTLDNYVSVYDKTTRKWAEGDYKTLASQYTNCDIFKDKNFKTFKNKVIVDLIQKDLEYYTSVNNSIARQNHWAYDFKISYLDDDKEFNTISDVSFFTFFQGLPIQGTNDTYSTYSFGISRIVNKEKYVGNSINGIKYYHSTKCPLSGGSTVIFDTKTKAAAQGYYPCTKCN